MTKFVSIALAAALLASGFCATGAGAQNVNLPFNGPLGGFTAKSTQSGHPGAKSNYAKSAGEKKARAVAQARAAERQKEQARMAAARRRDGGVTTAKSDDAEASPAAPVIIIPSTPPVTTAEPAAESTPPVTTAVITEAEPAPAAKTAEPATLAPAGDDSKRICRKFSAAVGSVIEVPCE